MCKKQRRIVPLRHNLIGIWQITPDVLHLSRVRVTDLVISPPIVGTLDHDDIGSWAAELDGVALTGELSAYHGHGNRGTAESCQKRWGNKKSSLVHSTEHAAVYFSGAWGQLRTRNTS